MMFSRLLLLALLLRAYSTLLAEPLDPPVPALLAAIRENPDNLEAYGRLGQVYLQAKEPEKALEAFGAMIAIDPGCQRAYLNIARLHNSLRQYAAAEKAARRAVDLRKMDLGARFQLGVALAGQRKNLGEAVENLGMASAEIPESHLQLSRIFLEKGDFEHAMEQLQAFRKTGPLPRP